MNILISAYAFYPSVGGLEEQARLLGLEWIKMGCSVDVLTEKEYPEEADFEVYHGISIYRIPYVKERTAVDHCKIIYHLSVFIIKNRKKYNFAMLRAAITLYPLIFGFWKFLRVIQYSTYVTADTGGENDEVTLIKKLPLYPLLRPIYAAHNYYNSICEANKVHYQEIAIPIQKLTTIPNGIQLTDHQYMKPQQIQTFLFLGRLFVYKGIRDLLAAFKKYHKEYPDARLLIGGDGPEASYVTKFITDNQLEAAVEYLGLVANKDKEAFFASGDCLVLPSYAEGFPISILEAMKYNKAVITTDVSDLKTLFSDLFYFCDIRNSDDLYMTMKNLKKTYSSTTLQYQKYLKNYNIEFIAKKIIALNT